MNESGLSVRPRRRRHKSREIGKRSSDQSLRAYPLLGRRLFARRFAVVRASQTLAIPNGRHDFVHRTAPAGIDRRGSRNHMALLRRRPSRMQGPNRTRHWHFGWMDLDAAHHKATPMDRPGGKKLRLKESGRDLSRRETSDCGRTEWRTSGRFPRTASAKARRNLARSRATHLK